MRKGEQYWEMVDVALDMGLEVDICKDSSLVIKSRTVRLNVYREGDVFYIQLARLAGRSVIPASDYMGTLDSCAMLDVGYKDDFVLCDDEFEVELVLRELVSMYDG